MARIKNPRKTFRFSITVISPFGQLEAFLVQDIQHPDVDVEPVSHGDVNYDVKTPGRVMVGNATLNKIMKTDGPDNFFHDWRMACQLEGVGGFVPDAVKKDIIVAELGEGGDTIINTHRWVGCWPTKITGQSNSRTESENTIESVELSVDEVAKV